MWFFPWGEFLIKIYTLKGSMTEKRLKSFVLQTTSCPFFFNEIMREPTFGSRELIFGPPCIPEYILPDWLSSHNDERTPKASPSHSASQSRTRRFSVTAISHDSNYVGILFSRPLWKSTRSGPTIITPRIPRSSRLSRAPGFIDSFFFFVFFAFARRR